MKRKLTPRVEGLEGRQFLSAGPGRPGGTFVLTSGASDAETEEIESAGHRIDFTATERRAAGDAPPRPEVPSSSFSLHDALREMAAAFEQSHGCDRGESTLGPLPWPRGSRLLRAE
jgi:hypothetical protein